MRQRPKRANEKKLPIIRRGRKPKIPKEPKTPKVKSEKTMAQLQKEVLDDEDLADELDEEEFNTKADAKAAAKQIFPDEVPSREQPWAIAERARQEAIETKTAKLRALRLQAGHPVNTVEWRPAIDTNSEQYRHKEKVGACRRSNIG